MNGHDMTAADLLIDCLAVAGVQTVFGVIGTTLLPVMDAISRRDDMRYVSARHEQAAASMAIGDSRVTRRPSVCVCHGGAGASNTVIAVASAMKNSIPLLVITGTDSTSKAGRDAFNELDLSSLFQPVTKRTLDLERPQDVVRIVRTALVAALSGRPGPVHIQVPQDVAGAGVGPMPRTGTIMGASLASVRQPLWPPALAAKAREQILETLKASARPVILLGGGVIASGASAIARQLVDAVGAACVATDDARGAVDEAVPHFVGVIGRQRHASAAKAVAEADCLLAIGSRLSDHSTDEWTLVRSENRLLHVDIDPAAIGVQYPVDVGAVADAAEAMESLTRACRAAGGRGRVDVGWVTAARAAFEQEVGGGTAAPRGDGRATARDVVLALNEVMSGQSFTLTVDSGIFNYAVNMLEVRSGTRVLRPGALGAMGLALPQALGVAIARPDAQVWVFVGDGGLAMVVQELETAVREKLPVKIIVFNNGGFGSQIVQQARKYGGRHIGVFHGNPDYAEVAKLYGAAGRHVASVNSLPDALHEAIAAKGPFVLDVPTPADDSPAVWI